MKSVLRIRVSLLLLFSFFIFTNVEAKTDAGNPEVLGLMKKVSGLQIPFIENEGQINDKSVRFYASTFAGTVFVTEKGEIVYSLIKTDDRAQNPEHRLGTENKSPNTPLIKGGEGGLKAVSIKESLVYSNQKPDDRVQNTGKIKGLNRSETKVNYFKGSKENWRTNIPTWQEVSLGEVYKGIELKLKAYGKNVEKLFTVHPEGSVDDIKLKIEGAKKLSINKDGELEVETEFGTVKFTKPAAYQEIDGKRVEIDARYKMQGTGLTEENNSELSTPISKLSYGFQVAEYDRTKPLIIDPALVYSTYLGGNSTDYGQGIVVDSSGNMYVSGTTYSTDFPTVSPIQGSNAGGADVFVTKIDASGSALLYSTYLGGSLDDSGCGNIAIDSSGNAYVTGYTYSTDFPTVSPLQGSLAGDRDAFVTKIDASGSALIYSTYLGGSGFDYPCGWSIAVDSSGNAYIAGETNSTNFPTVSPIQGSKAGGYDAFVTKINASGSAFVYSTYLGGSGTDASWAITVDSSGNAYIGGYTRSTNFPTVSPIQGSNAGNYDAFVAKINASGSALVYSTYLGGSSFEEGYCIAVDSSGNAYITGKTDSTNFPTVSPIQGSNAGGKDAFVAKIDASGSALLYSTYLGGGGYDVGWGIAVDSSGNAYVAGETSSTNFPTVSPIQGSNAGGKDAFVAKINASGSALLCSTYLGGSYTDYGWDIAVDSSGSAYAIGRTNSTNFPTVSPIQASNAGGYDAFVAKISSDAEVCDGVDNDCNGLIDDGIASTPTSCGVGACASTGTLSCVAGALVDSCTPGAPSTEVCDGIDNDCDGLIDDGIASTPTSCGVGACASTGTLSCVGGVMVDSCVPGTPSAEVCDGLDNDCDGLVDEGLLIRIGAAYYSLLQTAYNSAGEDSVIQTQDVQLIEDLSADLNKTVTIDGGYDCSYAIKTGKTRLKGQMTISNGKVTVKDFILEK